MQLWSSDWAEGLFGSDGNHYEPEERVEEWQTVVQNLLSGVHGCAWAEQPYRHNFYCLDA